MAVLRWLMLALAIPLLCSVAQAQELVAGVTLVDVKDDSMTLVKARSAGWSAMKCPTHLPAPGTGACTPANCSKGGIPAKWKTANLMKNKIGVKGNPLTVKKASPQTCCNTCAATPGCTYWQSIPDITIDRTRTPGACFLVKDDIDYTCGDLVAQFSTESKPVHLQVRTGGECNPRASISNDPHLVGAHGTHYDFNGAPDRSFCLLTDIDLHINMLLRGYYDERTEGASLVVDGKAVRTWIKELGIVWHSAGVDHKVRLAARSGKQQERGEGFMKEIEVDGEKLARMLPGDVATSAGGLSIRFVGVEKEGAFEVEQYALAIAGLVTLDVRLRVANPKLQRANDAEVHMNVGVNELQHTPHIHGVLGQTYRDDHVKRADDFQRLIAALHHPISADGTQGKGFLDGTPRSYETSSLLAPDCAHTTYFRAQHLSPLAHYA